jgi:hypothetical protein
MAALALAAMLAAGSAAGQTTVVDVGADADAFVWAMTPDANYGAASIP